LLVFASYRKFRQDIYYVVKSVAWPTFFGLFQAFRLRSRRVPRKNNALNCSCQSGFNWIQAESRPRGWLFAGSVV